MPAKGARVLSPTGRRLTEENIGQALATRELLADLRESGIRTGGPSPMTRKDRSRFLQELEGLIRELS